MEINKILFDLTSTQESLEASFHGGGEYAKFVFHEAIRRGKVNFECVYNPIFKLDQDIHEICIQNGIKLHEVNTVFDIEKVVNENEFNVFYSALPYGYGRIKFDKCKFIMTIHGLRELECPSDIYKKYYRKNNLRSRVVRLIIKVNSLLQVNNESKYDEFKKLINVKNKVVITVSNHSKYSLMNYFPSLPINEVKVIHAPIKLLQETKQPKNINNVNPKEFYLLVSANRWIKNNYRAIKALDSLFSEGKLESKKVVVIGGKGLPRLENVINKDKFIFYDYLEEDEFAWFFKYAFCFIYPTLNEGFGYPPLNAMNFKVPTLCSAISSVPEVCGNAVVYFNPFSIDEIRNRILQITYNEKLLKQLQINGEIRLKVLLEKQEIMIEDLMNIIFISKLE